MMLINLSVITQIHIIRTTPFEMFQRRFKGISKAFWRHFEGVLKAFWRRFEGVLKAFWRHFEGILKVFWRRFKGILKVFWRRFEGVSLDVLDVFVWLWTSIYNYGHILLDIIEHHLTYLDIYGHLWKSTEIYGYLWYLSVSSRQRLQFLQSKTSTYDAIASLD